MNDQAVSAKNGNILASEAPPRIDENKGQIQRPVPSARARPTEDKSTPIAGRNIGITGLIEICQQRAEAAFAERDGANQALYQALESTLELYCVGQENEDTAAELENQLEARGVRRTKRTNIFTRLVKLVFANSGERSNVNRYAAVLRFSVANSIKPNDLPDFIKSKGGIAKCTILEARSRKKQDQPEAATIERLPLTPAISLAIPGLPTEGVFSLVLIPKGDGEYSMLGHRKLSAKEVARYITRLEVPQIVTSAK